MRYFILADVHGNLEGLEVVMRDIQKNFSPSFLNSSKKGSDKLIILGDSIGYYPNPNEVMNILHPIADHISIGNHEVSVENVIERKHRRKTSNPAAEAAFKWTAKNLSLNNKKRLKSLNIKNNLSYVTLRDRLVFTHTIPTKSERWNYIEESMDALDLFFDREEFSGYSAVVGHSHIPQLYVKHPKNLGIIGQRLFFLPYFSSLYENLIPGVTENLFHDESNRIQKSITFTFPFPRFLAVVPSVGQQRGGTELTLGVKTGYCVLETSPKFRTLNYILLPYKYNLTQRKTIEAGLPESLAKRLEYGI